jgi:hypothetical protein
MAAPAGARAAAPGPALAAKSAPRADQASAPAGAGGNTAVAAPTAGNLDIFKTRAKQMIIYKAVLSIKVDKAGEASDKLRELADKNAGWVSGMDEHVDDAGNTRVTMEIRIPSGRFNDVMRGVAAYGKVDSESITTENVTDQWVDQGAHLEVLELRKQQLETLLKRAQSTEEIDKRQGEINAVQDEITRTQRILANLQDQVALSTISVTFYEKGLAPIGKLEPYSAKNIVIRAWYALVAVARVLFVILMWIALPGAVLWLPLVIWALWRRAHPKRSPLPPAPPPTG